LSAWRNPVYRFGLITFGLAALLAGLMWWFGLLSDLLLCWLISITLATFLTYGYDKAIAGSRRTRVPERVLLALTFAGGTLGALLGMGLFRHKTIKGSFRTKFWLVVAAQAILVVLYFAVLRPALGL